MQRFPPKQFIQQIIVPLTIISLGGFTKWWYVLPVDARESYFWGFPFAYVGEGWQTSGALQFFILEFIADFLTYFIFWALLFCLLNNMMKIKMLSRWTITALRTISFITVLIYIFIIAISYPSFSVKRDFEWKVIQSGYKFGWQQTPVIELNATNSIE